MKFILVESPTKSRTLSRFLGKDYQIEATYGHLRDLPKGELGVDTEKKYKPKYVIPKDKYQRVKELRGIIDKGDKVILAMDPDREGEAIAYHMAVLLSNEGRTIKSEKYDEKRFARITFHEITKDAIEKALKKSGKMNTQLIDAQQARRVLDRLVGYKLSPLLWKKLSRRWLSAGRVQSVAVRLIVEREKEIEKFKLQEYWKISSQFAASSTQAKENIDAELVSKDGIDYEQKTTIQLFDGDYTFTSSSIKNEKATQDIIKDFEKPFTISSVETKETKRSPAPPYTTAALQIDAGRRLGYSSKRTMRLAQQLYEAGLITYHRTDSYNLSDKFLKSARGYINRNLGKKYIQPRTFSTKSKLAQEAHEAIRPTRVNVTAGDIKGKNGKLRSDNEKVYDLIWKRAVATQAADAIFDSTTINITSANNYLFETKGSVIKFDGFLKIVGLSSQDTILPVVKEGEKVKLIKTIPEQKHTTPPARYSEASLIKSLEHNGIGRPSTYAPTISTIHARQYVKREEMEDGRLGRRLIPTELGILVNSFLVKYFPTVVDLPFTANMENDLDSIAQGGMKWQSVIDAFYQPFSKKLEEVEENVRKKKAPIEKTGKKCPECKKGEVIIKIGRFGKFKACSKFPKCKYTETIADKVGIKCPDCKKGSVVVKTTRKKRRFYGCSRYPDCKFASWTRPVKKKVKKK